MKKINSLKKLLLLSCLIIISSCGSKNEVGDFQYTFDDLAGFVKDNPTLIKTNAHTGIYCIKADTAFVYSITFKMKLGEMSSKEIKQIKLSGWCRHANTDADGRLVLSIDSPEKTVYNESAAFKDFIKSNNEWTSFEKTFDVKSINKKDFMCNIFLMNNGKSAAFLDDMDIKLIY